jgi:hypothetical protein
MPRPARRQVNVAAGDVPKGRACGAREISAASPEWEPPARAAARAERAGPAAGGRTTGRARPEPGPRSGEPINGLASASGGQ